MTSEDGHLFQPNQEKKETNKDQKKKNCYLPLSGGWFSDQGAPDPMDKSWADSCLVGFNWCFKEQTSIKRLDEQTKKRSHPPAGWEFDR